MSDTRGPGGDYGGLRGSGVGAAGRPAPRGSRSGRPDVPAGHRDKWPDLRTIAALVVDGILRLPSRYRRGMFMDIIT
jgi:hypothetical protein